MKNNIDNVLKEALLDEVKEISDTEDIFQRIEEDINSESVKRSKHYTSSLGFKKYFSLAACLLLLFTTLTFISSAEARALASKAISSIKTIFVVEKVNDELQIVEKPANEALTGASVCRSTGLTDEELEKKLGFTVRFPETLCNSFTLNNKAMGVGLGKMVDYETSQKLENEMFNAIEDDNALNKLKHLDAVRNVFGTYKKPDQSTIFVNITKRQAFSGIESLPVGSGVQKVKVAGLDGVWVETSYPQYPYKEENDVGKSDMSVKPSIKESSYLIWEKSDKLYSLNTYKDYKLTLEEALKIAEDFMKSN